MNIEVSGVASAGTRWPGVGCPRSARTTSTGCMAYWKMTASRRRGDCPISPRNTSALAAMSASVT